MGDSDINKELPTPDKSPVNHVENKEDVPYPSHPVTPESPTVDSENITSPVLNEQNIDSRLLNGEPTISNEERPANRDNIPDGFLDPEEVMLQRRALLNAAIASQENGSAFSCKYPGCNFTSTDVELYLKHEDSHIDGGSVECDVCNQQFSSYATMRRHRLIHLGVRPFECQMCAKRFLRKDQFMEHVLKHSKQRPYRCPFCSRSFGFRPHLKAHLTSDHPNIIVDKNCRICDFKSSSPNGAKVHFAMCHLKQTLDGSESHDRPHELIGSSQIHTTPENGAIDLATVSQNFSFVQAAHYSPYSASVNDSSAAIPGPSDLSLSSKIQHIAAQSHRHFMPLNVEKNLVIPVPEDNRHACVSALAGSTTMASPVTCQDRTCCRPSQNHEVHPRERVNVKPEPPELTVDDSQNSSVQPTSTMDISAVDVVETTCVSNEASGSSETPCRRKSHKHSSSDETGSESHNSPPSRPLDVQSTSSHSSRSVHTCYRVRQCQESNNQRCRDFSRHTCLAHRHPPEKRPRLSEGSTDRGNPNEHSDTEERKVFYNRATSTNSFSHTGIPVPRVIQHTSVHDGSSCTTESHTEPNFFGRKNTIVIRDIESCTLTCPYCGIIFPDQTLYLLHRSLHSEASPWKCNLCGKICKDKYDFNSHIISKGHY